MIHWHQSNDGIDDRSLQNYSVLLHLDWYHKMQNVSPKLFLFLCKNYLGVVWGEASNRKRVYSRSIAPWSLRPTPSGLRHAWREVIKVLLEIIKIQTALFNNDTWYWVFLRAMELMRYYSVITCGNDWAIFYHLPVFYNFITEIPQMIKM